MVQVMRQYCPVCRADVTHMQDATGAMRCVRCADQAGAPLVVAPPIQMTAAQWRQQGQQQAPARQRDGIVMGTIKLAGFVVALLILGSVGMCVYVCGSVAKPASKVDAAPAPSRGWETPSSTTRAEPAPPPEPEDPMDAVVRNWASDTGLSLRFVKPKEIHVQVASDQCSEAMLKKAIAKVRPFRMKPWGITRFSCSKGFEEKAVDVPR